MGKHNLRVRRMVCVRIEMFARDAGTADDCFNDIEREILRVSHRKVLESRYAVCGIQVTRV